MNRIISWGEVRLALRLIAKQPILSATVILALATGICVATIGFTFREAIVNGKLPYASADRFGRVFVFDREGNGIDLDVDRYHALRDRATSFEHVGAVLGRPFTLAHAPDNVEPINGTLITARSMRWVEATPLIGRTLIPSDGESGAEPVVVIRESLWHRRYAGDPSIIGRSLIIGGEQRTVVGVMPDTFKFPNSGELWIPINEQTFAGVASTGGQRIIAIVKPGVSFDAATVEADALARQFRTEDKPGEVAHLRVGPFTSDQNSNANIATSAIVFVLVMVLMVVASNVATLIFARTWSRAPELAVRTALGASRARVVGQLFLEMLVLGSVAAAIGLAGAFGIFQTIKGWLGDLPFWITLEPTPRIIGFVILLTVLVGIVSGLIPALRVTRHDLRNNLQAGRGFAAGGFGRMGAALLVIEIALSVGLLNGAVTMARAFRAYVAEVPALPVNQVLTAQMGRISSNDARGRIVEAARQLPGVIAVGTGDRLPRQYPLPRLTSVEPIGDERPEGAQSAPSSAVGEHFLEAIGAHAISGRLFTSADFLKGAAPVAVVNEPFVRKFLHGRNPIGRRIRIEGNREDGSAQPWREIVGVVPDLGMSVANSAMAAGFYIPAGDTFQYFLAIRTAGGDPLKLTPALRAAVARVDPDAQLDDIHTLEDAGYEERQFLSGVAMAMTAMGSIALLLSVVGIYALLSFMVTRRTREIGIRVALGATSRQVLQSVTGGAMLYLAVGGAIGTALGLLFLRIRDILLVSIPDAGLSMPTTIFVTLAIAGGVACWIPARRALAIRPSEALNSD